MRPPFTSSVRRSGFHSCPSSCMDTSASSGDDKQQVPAFPWVRSDPSLRPPSRLAGSPANSTNGSLPNGFGMLARSREQLSSLQLHHQKVRPAKKTAKKRTILVFFFHVSRRTVRKTQTASCLLREFGSVAVKNRSETGDERAWLQCAELPLGKTRIKTKRDGRKRGRPPTSNEGLRQRRVTTVGE